MDVLITKKTQFPKGLFSLFIMQMTAMVGFMFIFSMTTLYATKMLGYTDKQAYTLFAAYGAIVYGLPLFGGFLGDRFFGHKFAVLISTIFCGLGLICISIPHQFFFLFGLALFALATCIQAPNMYCLVGQLYDKFDERRHSGFTLAYVGMNVGAFAASASSGFLSDHFGFSVTYLIGALTMFLTLIAYFFGHKNFAEGFANEGDKASTITHRMDSNYNWLSRCKGILLFFIAVPVCAFGFHHPEMCNKLILIFGILAAAYIIGLGFKFDGIQRRKLWVFLILTMVSIGWGILYMTAPTALTLFAERNVDRHFLGFVVPTSSIISLDPFFIITCGPVLSALWLWLAHRKKNPSGAFKLSLGVITMGLGYLIFVPAIAHADQLGMTAFYWIIISYFLQTMGELLVNPVGYALAGSLAPARQEGFLMGFFQLGAGVASVLMGYMAGSTAHLEGITNPVKTNAMYSHAFWQFGFYSLLLGCIAIIFTPYFTKIIHAKSNEQAEKLIKAEVVA